MKFFAVIDTNVLVSALLSKHYYSATFQVVDKIFNGEIIPLYNNEILQEYEEVLSRKKFKFSYENIRIVIDFIKQQGINVNAEKIDIEFIDKDDLVFYEVAMEKRSENSYLVTGNIKHFPKESFIVTPAEMLEIINLS